MSSNKRKDKNRKPKYQQIEDDIVENRMDGLAKNLLLLVEGDTEVAYFEKLKQNSWLNGPLAGVKIEVEGDLKKAKNEAEKDNTVWFVTDNDKRNAFVLEENGQPFFIELTDSELPQSIRTNLLAAYNSDQHNYFLSIHDYLQWLSVAIGVENTIEYWDRIQFFTLSKVAKGRLFEEFDKDKKTKLKLAYSCIAFEFWLILHFEQNNTPFLWVDKEKDWTIDVVTHLKTLQPSYEKGYFNNNGKEKPCHAYNCLYDDAYKPTQTRADEWHVLVRIFKAIKNAEWLRQDRSAIFNRQSGKWYEVNPYIEGMDVLMRELLNIKPLGEQIDYFNMTIQFDFDIQNLTLTFQVLNVDNVFQISNKQRHCFLLKDALGNEFEPNMVHSIEFPNAANQPIIFQYTIPQPIHEPLVLLFKDPRLDSRGSQLFLFLN